MSTDSTSTNSSPNNNETHRLSTDSNEQMDNNIPKQTNSGYLTRSKKANLIFSVSRVENHLRKGRYAERISPTASVYLASVLEYLVAEMMELAGDMTHKSRRKRITPRDIALALKNDDDLAKLCSNVTIPEGGVQPFIHQVLLKTSRRRRKRSVRFNLNDTDGNLSSQSSDIDDSDLRME